MENKRHVIKSMSIAMETEYLSELHQVSFSATSDYSLIYSLFSAALHLLCDTQTVLWCLNILSSSEKRFAGTAVWNMLKHFRPGVLNYFQAKNPLVEREMRQGPHVTYCIKLNDAC